jgi:16S rRNA (adenine1518-N6/adenine1519-N6)-dimethyltransferase
MTPQAVVPVHGAGRAEHLDDPTTLGGVQQHDLHPQAALRFVDLINVKPGDAVLEVGPGLGAITHALLEAQAIVTAIETDPERVRQLRLRFATAVKGGRLMLVTGDATKVAPRFDGPWRVVANPPFHHTADFLRRWWLMDAGPRRVDLLLQLETARKLCGQHGGGTRGESRFQAPGHSRGSAFAAATGRPAIHGGLPRDAVTPPARVDLAFWSWTAADDTPSPGERRSLDALLTQAFAGPRTLPEALRGLATSTQVKAFAAHHGLTLATHPREVPPAAWKDLARLLRQCGKLPG